MNMLRKFKTKQHLTISKMYRQFDDWETGDVVIGTIIGTHTDKYGHECPVIKVLDCQFKKDAKMYMGKNLVINSTGKMRKNMPDIVLGVTIQVEYLGSNVMSKGKFSGKSAHDVDIQIVEEENESEDEVSSDDL